MAEYHGFRTDGSPEVWILRASGYWTSLPPIPGFYALPVPDPFFNWGDRGPASMRTAAAILAHALGSPEVARRLTLLFADQVLQFLSTNRFRMRRAFVRKWADPWLTAQERHRLKRWKEVDR